MRCSNERGCSGSIYSRMVSAPCCICFYCIGSRSTGCAAYSMVFVGVVMLLVIVTLRSSSAASKLEWVKISCTPLKLRRRLQSRILDHVQKTFLNTTSTPTAKIWDVHSIGCCRASLSLQQAARTHLYHWRIALSSLLVVTQILSHITGRCR